MRFAGGTGSENVGMSNVNGVKTSIAECLRFPVPWQSWQGESVLRRSRKVELMDIRLIFLNFVFACVLSDGPCFRRPVMVGFS